jgi:pimeloyl-ACP methyl ester carboxylesterase
MLFSEILKYGRLGLFLRKKTPTEFVNPERLLNLIDRMQVFVVGHDWGAMIAWYLCLFRPDRVVALVNTSVAFMRHLFIRVDAGAVEPTAATTAPPTTSAASRSATPPRIILQHSVYICAFRRFPFFLQ